MPFPGLTMGHPFRLYTLLMRAVSLIGSSMTLTVFFYLII